MSERVHAIAAGKTAKAANTATPTAGTAAKPAPAATPAATAANNMIGSKATALADKIKAVEKALPPKLGGKSDSGIKVKIIDPGMTGLKKDQELSIECYLGALVHNASDPCAGQMLNSRECQMDSHYSNDIR